MSAEPDAPLGIPGDDYTRRIEQLKEMRRELAEVGATAKRPDGLVTVVVGSQGQVKDIRLDPRVYRKLDSGELAAAIMELISQATAEVSEQMRTIMMPFVPGGDSNDGMDLTGFLPKAEDAEDTRPRNG
ncbi:YbaB/EbfC family nucleoid-associated protein [Actinoallomurus sp. NBC_01490]|jgi:DNA-binding protein YbaB|uniref:YbaB/EbfC family nucleoid-associated protein n=1 Tax=Actinoallomurus sp. NBC_01490 TaxID=2903557 RepID=UPI002E2F13AD|nr:YbaB/EbfC family nucleoid-associated protein [Actinoallomurus sp. NBC_01490]